MQEVKITNPLTREERIVVTDNENALDGCKFAVDTIEQLVRAFNRLYEEHKEQTLKVTRLRDALKNFL